MHEIKIFRPDSTGSLKLVEIKEAVYDSGVTPLRSSFPKKRSIAIVCEVCGFKTRTQVPKKTTCTKRSCELVALKKKARTREIMGLKGSRGANPSSPD
jgi:hypothetical protein